MLLEDFDELLEKWILRILLWISAVVVGAFAFAFVCFVIAVILIIID